MNKDEILAMSRQDNDNNDPFEREIDRKAMNGAHLAMLIVVFIVYISGIFIKGESDYLVWSIMAASLATQNLYRGIRLKKKDVFICGAVWVLIFIGSFIYGMMKLIRG